MVYRNAVIEEDSRIETEDPHPYLAPDVTQLADLYERCRSLESKKALRVAFRCIFKSFGVGHFFCKIRD